jgi:hypothetical protein
MVAADEKHPVEVLLAVVSVSGGCPRWRWQQPLSFIKANRLDIHSCRTSKLSDLHYEIIHPIVGYKAIVRTTISKLCSRTCPKAANGSTMFGNSPKRIDFVCLAGILEIFSFPNALTGV